MQTLQNTWLVVFKTLKVLKTSERLGTVTEWKRLKRLTTECGVVSSNKKIMNGKLEKLEWSAFGVCGKKNILGQNHNNRVSFQREMDLQMMLESH